MLVVEKGKCREERWYNYTPMPFSRPKEGNEAAHELLELYRGAVEAASSERCAGWNTSERRA